MRHCWCVFDVAGKESAIARLEQEVSAADLWQDPARAQTLLQRLGQLQDSVAIWRGLEHKARELVGLLDMAIAEEEQEVGEEIATEVATLHGRLQELEFGLLFAGPYDHRSCVLAVHAGAGGTESQDWTAMLLRMYLRWGERRGYQCTIVDTSLGEEAGLKSAVVEVMGALAYGYLRGERGVHRLVRLSPFDADHGRHTSFALVEVMPEVESEVEVGLNPDDLRFDFFRSSSAGGQNVQKTSTAVRVVHVPTGIVVSCQNERSQLQNRQTALRILEARLLERELDRQAEERIRLKGEHVPAEWGNQIRSYILHPYKLVKDHRTGLESTDPLAALEGELTPFMEAFLRWSMEEPTS